MRGRIGRVIRYRRKEALKSRRKDMKEETSTYPLANALSSVASAFSMSTPSTLGGVSIRVLDGCRWFSRTKCPERC